MNRTEHFQQGITGGGPTASLLQTQQSQNSMVKGFDPSSVLNAYQQPGFHPANGNSASDAKRQLPTGSLPSKNGYSGSTYDMRFPSIPTRLAVQ